jgi:hypothetical protein
MGSDRGRVAHPYGDLLALAERERDLIATRDYDGLAETLEARAALMADLPRKAPEEAHGAIAELIELHRQNDAAMRQASRGLEVELGRLRTGRAGVRRYAPGGAPRAKRLDFSA